MKNEHVFRNPQFLFIWLGNAISELGGAFGTFCNSILIYQLTGSSMALGSMWLLYFIPSLILQLFIGPFIDKWSRKWIMVFAQWTRAIVFLLPLLAFISGDLQTWHIYVVQIIVGFITPFYVPANHAITPTIVSKSQLSTANAYIDGMVRLMSFLAPITGGIVIEYIGIIPTLSLVCIVLSTSGTLLLFIKEKSETLNVRKSWLEDFREGISFFFKQRIIVWLGIFLAFVQFGVGVTMVTTLPYITMSLSGSYADYGYFMAAFPIGYVIGTLVVGKITFKSRRLLMLGSLAIGGLTFIWLFFNQSIALAIPTEIIAGMAMAIFSVHNMTICQQTVPNHLMGKIFSVRLLIIRGAMPLGVLIGGLLSEILGVRPLYLIIGSIICTVSLIGMLHPYFKFIDSTEATKNAA
ncbi:MFS transporter [Evansella cellulosilytica]|uniref:Major facilitator superfamily MFS_1 n=1 Tax=Evansella cellulosilytica (strain ATCC 21833 / DSM 2522 / FERM P-1141 / JCM 9156 / N-4) TaxID=649639 RepID=E6U0Q5_EVAC2|nr:MFS transporter [Evansella cellulosilytica]ADU29103.1 major facilitator superfamily MFS_1 [Evansella cellulosilytica DSM 2522]